MGLIRKTGARGVVIELRSSTSGTSTTKTRVGPSDIGRPLRISAGPIGASAPRRPYASRRRSDRSGAVLFYAALALSLLLYVSALMLDAWTALLLVAASGALAVASGLACSESARSSGARVGPLRLSEVRSHSQRTS
jgi:hypothetical protein